MTSKKCQYQAPHCQGQGEFQHILKLGAVPISKQWVCSNCRKVLEPNNHDQQ